MIKKGFNQFLFTAIKINSSRPHLIIPPQLSARARLTKQRIPELHINNHSEGSGPGALVQCGTLLEVWSIGVSKNGEWNVAIARISCPVWTKEWLLMRDFITVHFQKEVPLDFCVIFSQPDKLFSSQSFVSYQASQVVCRRWSNPPIGGLLY